MGDLVEYKITNIGDLKVENEYDYDIQFLHLSVLSSVSFQGDLKLNIKGKRIQLQNIYVFDALLSIYDGLLEVLVEKPNHKPVSVVIADLKALLFFELDEYELKIGYAGYFGHCDFKNIFCAVNTAIKEFICESYNKRPELAMFEINEGSSFNIVRHDWIIANKNSLPYKIKKDLLASIGRPFLL